MTKDLDIMAIIRLQTELENAIGFREYYLKKQDIHAYNAWDCEVDNIIDEIIKLGE